MPTTAPTATCSGVCPKTSFNCPVLELTGWSGGNSVIIIFNTEACFPACKRTPVASYITCTREKWRYQSIRKLKITRQITILFSLTPSSKIINYKLTTSENTRAIAKKGLFVPCITPRAVVRPITREVWDDGMPPEPTSRVKSHSLVIKWCVNTFAVCAKKKPRKAATNALQKEGKLISQKSPVGRHQPTLMRIELLLTVLAKAYPLWSTPSNPLRTTTSSSPFGRGGDVSMFRN